MYIANILKCRPDTPGKRFGNRPPTSEEMATCSPWLHRQIEFIQPKIIVALGKPPWKACWNNRWHTRFRGSWQTYRGIPDAHISSSLPPANQASLKAQNLGGYAGVWKSRVTYQ